MTLTTNILNHILICSYWILTVLVTIKILIKKRTVSSFIAWILIIYILPVIGSIIYLLFGETNIIGIQQSIKNKTAWISSIHQIKNLNIHKHVFSCKNSEIATSLFKLCEYRQGIGAFNNNNIKLFKKNNEILMSLIKDMELAQHSINMVFYIWEPGGLVNHIAQKLILAARRGIKCRLILDSVGCINFFNSIYPKILREAGIHVVKALHINVLHMFLRRMDLRQHRKMILIDNYIAYTGSMNMVDPNLFKQNIGVGQWIDIMIRINGPASYIMGMIFEFDWEMETGENIIVPKLSNIQHAKKKQQSLSLGGHTIQIIPSGPGFPKGIIHQVLITLLYKASTQLIITTPYLVPSDDLLYAICTAAQRGVQVHIIIPKNNDSVLVNWASRSFFSELLNAGVCIHRFQKGLLHVKSILIDRQLSLIGTVNLDIRSIWLNSEITLLIDSKKFSRDLEKIQQDYILNSELIDLKKWENRPYWERIIERLFYFLSPLL